MGVLEGLSLDCGDQRQTRDMRKPGGAAFVTPLPGCRAHLLGAAERRLPVSGQPPGSALERLLRSRSAAQLHGAPDCDWHASGAVLAVRRRLATTSGWLPMGPGAPLRGIGAAMPRDGFSSLVLLGSTWWEALAGMRGEQPAQSLRVVSTLSAVKTAVWGGDCYSLCQREGCSGTSPRLGETCLRKGEVPCPPQHSGGAGGPSAPRGGWAPRRISSCELWSSRGTGRLRSLLRLRRPRGPRQRQLLGAMGA